MNIGIIVHSQTGNTYNVAEKLEQRLKQLGNDVNLERITTIGDVKSETKEIKLDKMPSTEKYDAIIFGGWIQAFRLYPGMEMYLNQLSSLKNKKIACFVTMQFPFKWMGGKNGTAKIKQLVEKRDGKLITSGIIGWSRKDREQNICALIEDICNCLI